jgi:hypothetical protein
MVDKQRKDAIVTGLVLGATAIAIYLVVVFKFFVGP